VAHQWKVNGAVPQPRLLQSGKGGKKQRKKRRPCSTRSKQTGENDASGVFRRKESPPLKKGQPAKWGGEKATKVKKEPIGESRVHKSKTRKAPYEPRGPKALKNSQALNPEIKRGSEEAEKEKKKEPNRRREWGGPPYRKTRRKDKVRKKKRTTPALPQNFRQKNFHVKNPKEEIVHKSIKSTPLTYAVAGPKEKGRKLLGTR